MALISWISHPLRDEPGFKSSMLIVIIIGVSTLVGFSFRGLGYACLSAVILGAAMSRYLLPTRYTLDRTGVIISHLGIRRSLPWTRFQRIDRHADGVFLSPFKHPNRLDTFRGYFLRADHRVDEVLHVVQQHIADDAL